MYTGQTEVSKCPPGVFIILPFDVIGIMTEFAEKPEKLNVMKNIVTN